MERACPGRDAGRHGRGPRHLGKSAAVGRRKLYALLLLLCSGLLGFVAMNARLPLAGVWDGFDGNMLFPLLTGLFGLPTLLSSMTSGPVPKQERSAGNGLEVRAAMGARWPAVSSGGCRAVTSTTGT